MALAFDIGDRVVNPARPEWGVGTVRGVETVVGRSAVRVRVRFAGAGVKTLVVPPARLVAPGSALTEDQRVRERLGYDRTDEDRLLTLPGVVADRLAGLDERFDALAETFRYEASARGAFDWAVRQLGCDDPLSRFSADELQRHFERFRRERDRALRDLRFQAVSAGAGDRFDARVADVRDARIRATMREALGERE